MRGGGGGGVRPQPAAQLALRGRVAAFSSSAYGGEAERPGFVRRWGMRVLTASGVLFWVLLLQIPGALAARGVQCAPNASLRSLALVARVSAACVAAADMILLLLNPGELELIEQEEKRENERLAAFYQIPMNELQQRESSAEFYDELDAKDEALGNTILKAPPLPPGACVGR